MCNVLRLYVSVQPLQDVQNLIGLRDALLFIHTYIHTHIHTYIHTYNIHTYVLTSMRVCAAVARRSEPDWTARCVAI